MNKKFSTFLVAALLAGGSLLSPAFAALNDASTAQPTGISLSIGIATTNVNVDLGVYYLIKSHDNATPSMASSWSLQATKDGVSFEKNPAAITANNLWRVVPLKSNGTYNGNFNLVNANGQYLAAKKNADGTYVFAVDGNLKEFKVAGTSIALAGEGVFLKQSASNEPVLESSNSTLQLQFFAPKAQVMNADLLNAELADNFALQIGYFEDDTFKEYDLEGNAFAGTLKAKSSLGTSYTFATLAAGEVFLTNADGEVIVLLNEKWSKQNTDLIPDVTDANKGYKFTTMSPKALANQLEADKKLVAEGKTAKINSYVFRVSEPNTVVQAPLEVAVKLGTDVWAELLVAEVNGSYLLTTATAANDKTTPANEVLTLSKADYTGAKTFVRFGQNNLVNPKDFWGAAWNITRLSDGKTIIPTGADWVEASHVAYTKPEGQWILNDDYQWTNRETTKAAEDGTPVVTLLDVTKLRTTDTEGVYRIGTTKYSIVKAAELGGRHTDFYGDEIIASETGINRTYKVVFNNVLTGEPAYIGMDGIGAVKLTSNVAEAIPFQAKKMKTTDNIVVVDGNDVNANYDVFNIISEYMKYDAEKEKWVVAKDTVSYNRFKLEYAGKYLKNVNGVFALVNESDRDNDGIEDAVAADVLGDAYVIKEKDGSLVNVISVDNEDWDKDRSTANVTAAQALQGEKILYAGHMMYFDFNYGLPEQQINIYNWVSNAQLVIEGAAAAEYRTLAAPDTLEFYRTEFADEFLFENGEFAGMTYNRTKYNPAIFVDTAYVRNETTKPYYMLAVGVEKTDATKDCPICHKPDCEHAVEIPGMIAARYLVAYTDSAAAHAVELDNKFYYNDTKMTKLGFVPAVHHVDTLVISNDSTKYTVGNEAIHPAKFAFRIVNQETQDFVIETAKLVDETRAFNANSNPYRTAYVKWHNGCPVLTWEYIEAEVFNVRETSEAPTANEGVEVSEVSVVAANGAVIVKGAEGKNVAVSNILGQTIANTVVSSDNATIAVPAGIVVVAVEGEEAVKVVVK